MEKTVLFAFNGDPICFIHVLLNALELKENKHEAGIVMEGAAVTLIPELAREDHPLHTLYLKTKDAGLFYGACQACSAKLGVLDEIKAQEFQLLAGMNGHPGMAGYLADGYTILTF